MGYGNQGYGQRGGYGNQQQQERVIKGRIDFVEERETQNGKMYHAVGIKGKEFSVWDPHVAETMAEGMSGTAVYTTQGRYSTIREWEEGEVAEAPQQTQTPARAPMQSSGRAWTNDDYWKAKFDLDKQQRQDILRMNAIGNARQIVKDCKDLGILNLDKYVKEGRTPQQAYLGAIYELSEDLAAHVLDQNDKIAPKHNVREQAPARPPVGDGAVQDGFQQPG
jgi:hypothetical protein